MKSLRWYLAELGVKVYGISVMFDLTNSCTFKCPSCPVGNSPKRTKGVMSIPQFRAILDRLEVQTRLRYVLLYSFSEPFVHPQIHEAVAELKKRRVPRVMISTNLSLTKNVEKTLAAGLDELRISFSGFRHGEYFHTGRDMDQFTRAMTGLSRIAPKYKTKISVIWHRYKNNLQEEKRIEEYVRSLGFKLIKETAFFIPFEKIVHSDYTSADRQLIGHLIQSPEEKLARQDYDPICYYQQKQIVIDANGKVFLCRHVFDKEFIVGDIMEDTLDEIRTRMAGHKFCLKCKSCGLNKYTEPK